MHFYLTFTHSLCRIFTLMREDLRVMGIKLLVHILLSMIEKATRRTTHCIPYKSFTCMF